MIAGVGGRLFFLNQGISALLLGRKPGSAKPGTVLVRTSEKSREGGKLIASPSGEEGPALKVKFDVLGGWKFVEGKTPIPDKVRKLDGQQIEVTGFMMPINETKSITRFIVVQSLWGCCFGQVPAVNHVIVVNMASGKSVEFYPDPVRVTGRFSVGETREEGYLVSIYHLEAVRVVVR